MPAEVFESCPFNDTLAQVIRGVRICGTAYSLTEQPVEPGRTKRLTQPQFSQLIGEGPPQAWPFHDQVRQLLSDR